jgi:hypothetical protein
MVGSNLWLPKNPVVSTVILWYKPHNSVDLTALFLGTLLYRAGAHIGLYVPHVSKYIQFFFVVH